MLKENSTNWARVCETCRSAACTVYCRADAAYLCTGCDSRIHAANPVVSRHERVWVCEACERAPAAFMCKADSASLCASCDADIHSANPLARRHHRVPILPIPGCSRYGPAATVPAQERIDEDEDEAASWLLQNPIKDHTDNNQNINGFLFGGEVVDEYLDLNEYNSSCNDENQLLTDIDQYSDGVDPQKSHGSGNINGGDRAVPVESGETKGYNYQFGIMEYHETSKPTTPYAYPPSISHSVSISSMDTCVVPESTRSSDVSISISHPRPPKGTIDIFSNNPPIQMPPQVLTPVDREARVLRYREKKKTRKFEKTIRYASRKAYAETRPRIKGRFAKRTAGPVEVEVDQMFSTTLLAGEGRHGIVPSF